MIDPQSVIEPIDKVLNFIWHQPLRLLTAITGKSNYFFARMIINICMIIFAFTAVACIGSMPVFSVLSIAILFLNMFIAYVIFPKFEVKQKANPDLVVGADFFEILLRIYISLLAIILLLLTPINKESIPIPIGIAFAMGYWTFAGGMYWVRDIQPPSKSVWRKTFDWLKAHRPSLIPSHTPLPLPS